ncbi:Protein transport protein SEC B [Ananas comosus]|uniref:Protein transport protein SEC B n=1 Tax=Ananas comosus TaxID=4615 RepID=A0A199UW85_ANACO|nr:Protein transport protein SEC B [Ananas comosus]
MACIKSAQRSALAAFAPDAPYLAAGTMAGAVDLSFSSSANLEIFKLDFQSDALDLPLVASCPARALQPPLLVKPAPPPTTPRPRRRRPRRRQHRPLESAQAYQVRGLEFSVLSPNLLASGADEGELCIWDLANLLNQISFFLNFSDSNRRRCSVLQWNPDISTQLIIASDDDSSPSLRVMLRALFESSAS